MGHPNFGIPLTFVIRASSLFETPWPGKKASREIGRRFSRLFYRSALIPVITDGFDRATFFGFLTLGFFLGRTRLLINERITAVVIAFEIVGSGLAAKVAVDALVIDVVFARHVFRIPVRNISHKSRRSRF